MPYHFREKIVLPLLFTLHLPDPLSSCSIWTIQTLPHYDHTLSIDKADSCDVLEALMDVSSFLRKDVVFSSTWKSRPTNSLVHHRGLLPPLI